jgi:hypothetical protein
VGLYLLHALLMGLSIIGVTLHQVRLLMAEEEKAKVEAGTGSMHDVSAGAFLLLGMDIQVLQ